MQTHNLNYTITIHKMAKFVGTMMPYFPGKAFVY